MQDQQLALLPNVSITSRSLSLPENCTLELWEDCGTKIGVCVDAGPFIIGDWLNEGMRRYGVSLEAFRRSEAAKNMPGISTLSYDSLNSYASVMEKLPQVYRIKGVSFAHHQAASRLVKNDNPETKEEAKKWLLIAKEKSLSLRELAFAIQGRAQIGDIERKPKAIAIQSNLAIKLSITDIALALHRSLKTLNEQFDPENDPIAEWADNRKEAAIIALKPLMDDLALLTDHYIELRK